MADFHWQPQLIGFRDSTETRDLKEPVQVPDEISIPSASIKLPVKNTINVHAAVQVLQNIVRSSLQDNERLQLFPKLSAQELNI